MIRLARRYHQGLMIFAGLQFFLWSVSGLYMVLMNIHSIHGEDLTVQQQPLLSASMINKGSSFNINTLIRAYPDASNINLAWLADKPVYRFVTQGENKLLSAITGKLIPEITSDIAMKVALSNLREPLDIEKLYLITDKPPDEIGSRALPLWRVDFYGVNSPTFYISHQTGEVLTIRHNTWRLFDALWRLHIMDYTEGEDINNILLNVFTISGLLAALSGLVLLAFRLLSNESAEPAR
ncbi:MAG: hypothetical protein ACI97K_002262 [Glaciecola sp.]|jgi:hypothetical protein